jgi:hypothetical protein
MSNIYLFLGVPYLFELKTLQLLPEVAERFFLSRKLMDNSEAQAQTRTSWIKKKQRLQAIR